MRQMIISGEFPTPAGGGRPGSNAVITSGLNVLPRVRVGLGIPTPATGLSRMLAAKLPLISSGDLCLKMRR